MAPSQLHFNADELAALHRRARRHGTNVDDIITRIVRDEIGAKRVSQGVRFWKAMLEEGDLAGDGWPKRVSAEWLHQVYLDWCQRMNEVPTHAKIGLIRNCVEPFLGARVRVCIEGGRAYERVLMPLQEARRKFARVYEGRVVGGGAKDPEPRGAADDPPAADDPAAVADAFDIVDSEISAELPK